MLSQTLTMLKSRKNFYRDCYYRVLNFLLFSFVLIFFLLLLLIFFIINRPDPQYYATSMSGEIRELKWLDQPNYLNKPLIP